MNLKRAICVRIGYFLIFSLSIAIALPAYSDFEPCPPRVDASQSASCRTQSITPSLDSEFGAGSIVAGAACPGIPTSFPVTHTVANDSDFWTKYQAANCGDALIFTSSFSWKTDRTLGKNCSADKPLYILGYDPAGEGIQARTYRDASANLDFTGDYHVLAGFRLTNHARYDLKGSRGTKILCNSFNGGTNPSGVVYIDSNGRNDEIEVAYNAAEGTAGGLVAISNCDETNSSCNDMPENWWIHHNTLKNKEFIQDTNSDGIKTGSGIERPSGVTTYHSPHGSHFGIIENNLFDNFQIGDEIISAKSSGLVIRNNCVLNGGNIGSFTNRKGFNNVWYGNWIGEQKYGAIIIAGRDNIVAYNYFRAPSGGNGLRLHPGTVDTSTNRYNYVEASDNVFRRNVWSNITRMIEILPRSTKGTPKFIESPSGNTYSDNAIHSGNLIGSTPASSFADSSGQWNSNQFCANNTCGSVSVRNSSLPQSTCGNPALFDGPTGGPAITVPDNPLYHPDIRNKTIPAPVWW